MCEDHVVSPFNPNLKTMMEKITFPKIGITVCLTALVSVLLFAGLSVFFAFMGMEWAAVTAIGCPALYGLSSFLSSKKSRVDTDLP